MKLYFSPLACSLATRIALYEAGADVTFVEVDARTKRTLADGADFYAINPMGLVPTLATDDGTVLTENIAILSYLADRFPAAELGPRDGAARTRLLQWLSFTATELHKAVFNPVFDRKAPDAVKAYALGRAAPRLAIIEQHLAGRTYLLDAFSVADAYLVTVLTWTLATPIKLADYPALAAYSARLRERPSVARALAEERPLYAAERTRDAAAITS